MAKVLCLYIKVGPMWNGDLNWLSILDDYITPINSLPLPSMLSWDSAACDAISVGRIGVSILVSLMCEIVHS